MKKKRLQTLKLSVLVLTFLISTINLATAQITVYSGQTATTLAQTLAGAGVSVSNATMTCENVAYATFAVTPPNTSNLGIDSGLVLTSGSAYNNGFFQGVNNPPSVQTTSHASNFSDPDLDLISNFSIEDACVLEFDFVPTGDTVKFVYVFGSCEYPSFTCSSFNDVFGFFISGPGITGPFSNNSQNIAIVPGTTSCPVSINTINCPNSPGCCNTTQNCVANTAGCTGLTTAQTCNLFVCNNPGGAGNNTVLYPGFTIPMTAVALTQPCSTYHLKLAISDASDQSLDSGVFLKAGSLTSNNVSLSPVSTLNAPEPYVVEGCAPGGVKVTRPVADPTPLTVSYIVSGTATNGVDYNFLPGTIVIPANQTSAIIPISALSDGVTEGKEIVTIIKTAGCSSTIQDSASIAIYDSIQFKLYNADTFICRFDTVQVVALSDTALDITWTPISYISNDTIANPKLSPLTDAVYVVTANIPNSGCVAVNDTLRININIPPSVSVGPDVSLCKNMTKQFNTVVSPANQVYTYSWTPSTYLNSTTIQNPIGTFTTEGTYTYYLTVSPTAQGCKGYDTVVVEVLPNDIILHNGDTSICDGASVFLDVTGSTKFSYLWTPPLFLNDDTIQDPVSTPTYNISYTVTATYPGCMPMSKSININVEPHPIVNLGPDREMCLYDTLRLYGNVSPSTFSPYTYVWNPTTNLTLIQPNEVIFSGASGAVYTLTATTPAGCRGSDDIQITVWPVDFAAVNPAYKGMCPGDSILYNVTGPGITAITWQPQTHLTNYNINNPICYPTTSLTYTIYVQDIHSCVDTLNSEVFVAQNAVLDVGPDLTLYPGDIHTFTPNTNCITVNWSPSAFLSATNIPNPVISNATVSQQYVVNGVTDYGCKVVDTVIVTVDPNSYINLPNAFAPGTQTNPIFAVDKLGIATLNSFRIYNRWGNLVYESSNISEGWDGSYKGQPQPMDTYIYTIDAVTSDGKKFQKTGNVLLIR